MLDWKNVTDSFTEPQRHWKGRYLELCEVTENEIELSLFSCPYADWDVYVSYGRMYGVSYTPSAAAAHHNAMKAEIEAEYVKHGLKPSGEFINAFAEKYQLDIMNAIF